MLAVGKLFDDFDPDGVFDVVDDAPAFVNECFAHDLVLFSHDPSMPHRDTGR